MKNKIIILTVFAGLLLSACSDYLDRKPYTQPNNEDFLKTRENVESYINNLYTSLPAPAQYGIGVRGEEVNSDNILSEKYDMRLNGENNQFSGSDDWNKGYKNLRMVNYFFHYYAVSEVDETDEVLSLRGEAYFFVLIGTSICSHVLVIFPLWMTSGMAMLRWAVCKFLRQNVRMPPVLS